MNLSEKGNRIGDAKRLTLGKVTTLNPNAAEFVPFSLRSQSSWGSTSAADGNVRFAASGTIGKPVLDQSGSSVSNNSGCSQLPDDITSDLVLIDEEDYQGIGSGNLSLAGLSLHDGSKASRFLASADGEHVYGDQQELLHHYGYGNKLAEKLRYSASSYGEDRTSASFLHLPTKTLEKQLVRSDKLLGNCREGHPYNRNSRHGCVNNVLREHKIMDGTEMNPIDILVSQFPGFAAESLAEVHFSSGGDLNLTIEMLTQLELQADGGFNQNPDSNTLPAPNPRTQDFSALTVSDDQSGPLKFSGDKLQHRGNRYRSSDEANVLMFKSSSSLPSIGAVDFASAVKKISSDSGMWKHGRNGYSDPTIGSSRSSYGSTTTYSAATGRGAYANKVQTRDAVDNLYSELREEARDHARLRNAYFEEASQAFLIGNKALTKELSLKGQLHNMHMKAAHGKAQESIYRQRNPVYPENVRGQERMIDLHGLHVSEAIHLLKHELSVLKSTARAADQRLQVYIFVGTGHHTRGSRTQARLSVSIQRYLFEEECLDFTEPQPGVLRVVIY